MPENVTYNNLSFNSLFVVRTSTAESVDASNEFEQPVTTKRRVTVQLQAIEAGVDLSQARDNMTTLITALRVQHAYFKHTDEFGNILTEGVGTVVSPLNFPVDALFTIQPFEVVFEVVIRTLAGAPVITRTAPLIFMYGSVDLPNVGGVSGNSTVARQYILAKSRDLTPERWVVKGKIDESGSDDHLRRVANLAKLEEIKTALKTDFNSIIYGSGSDFYEKAAVVVSWSYDSTDYSQGIPYQITFDTYPILESTDEGIYEFHATISIEPSVEIIPFYFIPGQDGEITQDTLGKTGHKRTVSGMIVAVTESDALAKYGEFLALLPSDGVLQSGSSWVSDCSLDTSASGQPPVPYGKFTFSATYRYAWPYELPITPIP